jgi:hypothetical protein
MGGIEWKKKTKCNTDANFFFPSHKSYNNNKSKKVATFVSNHITKTLRDKIKTFIYF